jgi:colanic acid biosynthesis glycosyl transferase WcaI
LAEPTARPRLLVFNQYYFPGVEATAHLLTELCESLASEYDVTVVTGRLRDHEGEPDYEIRNGVEVVRVHSTSFDRARLHHRAANYFTYLARAFRRGIRVRRPDVVLCMTDPPLVGDVAYLVARRFRRPLVVVSQDVFPEIAVRLGRLGNPILIALLRASIGFYLRRADRIVAIGTAMRRRLIAKGAPEERVRVIPNWVDTDAIAPRPRDNPWAQEHGLVDRFVVMHSGNVGHAQNLELLIRAAPNLADVEGLAVVVAGFGARHAHHLALAERLGAQRVSFLPYQPRERLSESLSSADIHYVGLAPGLAGFVVPSRVYGILAAGRPILAAVDADSETAALVQETGCGIVVAPDDLEALVAAIRALAAGEHDLAAMGARGRAYAEREGGLDVAVGRYREVLAETVASGAR